MVFISTSKKQLESKLDTHEQMQHFCPKKKYAAKAGLLFFPPELSIFRKGLLQLLSLHIEAGNSRYVLGNVHIAREELKESQWRESIDL